MAPFGRFRFALVAVASLALTWTPAAGAEKCPPTGPRRASDGRHEEAPVFTPGERAPDKTPAQQRGALGERPNIVLVMSDDQGYGDLGCHGNRYVRTPRIDQFYKESVRLVNFHVDPTSAPTRAALMTGRYSARTGVWHDMMGRSLLRIDEYTIGAVFGQYGYRTGIFGKWHLGDGYPYRPSDRGFDESLVHGAGGIGQSGDYWGNTHFNPVLVHNGRLIRTNGYSTNVFFDAAIRFIEENARGKFLVSIMPNAPQAPYQVPQQYRDMYVSQGINFALASFYGMITNLDENFGRLLQRLDELGLAENTIVIFMTDSGGTGQGFANSEDQMRGGKGTAYEGGHRVPCFIRWPRKLKPDFNVEEITSHIDVIPTLLQLCDLKGPADVRFDGQGMLPLLVGNDTWAPRTLFVQSQGLEKPQKWRGALVMTEEYRLVNGRDLYNLKDDPTQQNNLGPEHPKTVDELRFAYEEWYKSVSERFGEYCRIFVGAEKQNPVQLSCFDWHGLTVPWHQQHVLSRVEGNGFWAIRVLRPGHYQITLRERPRVANYPLPAGMARLRVGQQVRTVVIPPGSLGATFDLNLEGGDTDLQGYIAENNGPVRGAYYVEVAYVGPAVTAPPQGATAKQEESGPVRRQTRQPGAY